MRTIKRNFLILSTIAAFSIMGMGICLAENSWTGIVLCFLILCTAMIYGFKQKKKLQKEDNL
ncbi:hypothetical protein ACA29_20110 [Lederbergia galactosidilytica]|uniref:Uncharacterized protein n=1 Tax=Lederbergia galactosidilytica TaxID=217031 RepID=A0A0Q9Y1V5_9BACI|nr:hypothetical protein ACA29_20110 [Lederbergia galactosidilytica]